MQLPDSTVILEMAPRVIELLKLVVEPPDDAGDFETRCMGNLMALGRVLMQHHLKSMSPEGGFTEGDLDWRVAVKSRLAVMTTFGCVDVERPLFRSERNGPTRCLVEERAGLMAGFWTRPAAKLAAMAVAEMPMARAESFFAEAGIVPASRSSLLRLAGWLSDLWEDKRIDHEAAVREATPIPENATTVAVSLDGVMVIMVGSDKAQLKAAARARGQIDKGPAGWREASVAVVSFYDADGERLATRRFGRMPETNKATTKAWLRKELEHIRAVRPDLTTIAIADGAANNWTFLADLDADYEVVDFFHTAEHLHRHVSKANGASSLDTQAKLKHMRHQLLCVPGGAAEVFEDMQKMREATGTAAKSTQKKTGKRQPTFFDRHHKRMNYAELLAKKLPIGSGVTESTCKLTICDRLRRTGMRWSAHGGQAVITLRAHRVSDTFDAAWQRLTSANRVRLAA